jgi:O-antigen ligase
MLNFNFHIRHLSFLIATITYFVIVVINAVSYFPIAESAEVEVIYRYSRWLTVVSLAYFFFLFVASIGNRVRYCFILPLVILTVPNAINSIFPGIMLGPTTDKTNASFPFITHIDFFLVAGILQYIREPHLTTPFFKLCFFISGLMLLFLSGVVYLVFAGEDLARYLNNAFHIRYMALLYLLHPLFLVPEARAAFIRGVIYSVPIILLEAGTSTLIAGASFLGQFSSGNFANNNFGHLLATMFIFLFGVWRHRRRDFMISSVLVLLAVSVAATGVRGALLALFLTFATSFVFKRLSFSRVLLISVSLIGAVSFLLLNVFDLSYWKRFFEGVIFIAQNGFDAEKLAIDPMVTSLFTRVALWVGTIQMILDYPIYGVGFANWNLLKSEFGIPFRYLLDPHNEFLFFLSSYGVVPGLGFFLLVHLGPVSFALQSIRGARSFNPYFFALLCFFFSGITNANSSKHQVFALVLSIVFLGLVHAQQQSKPKFN